MQYGHTGVRSSEHQIAAKTSYRSQYNESDGRILAYSTFNEVVIMSVADDGSESELCRLALEEIQDFALSPSGRHLSTFCSPPTGNLTTGEAAATTPNLRVWRLPSKKGDGPAKELAAFLHKQQHNWSLQWTSDETFFARQVGNEVRFHRADDASRAAFQLRAEHLGGFALSPGAYPKAAIFLKEANGEPAAVKIFLLPNVQAPVAAKHFFKADKVQFMWSPTGKHLLALTHTDVDSTGQSYYGENSLYFLAGDGSFDGRVSLDKAGPVHDVAWGPRGDEYVVSYGYMPSRLTLFNLKCEPAFIFPVESKNCVKYSPAGNLIAFGGFGNLPGYVEIWTRSGTALRCVGSLQATGSSIFEWAPSGHCLVTATVTPRLRVDNGYRIWSWTGELLEHKPYGELYQVAWRPRPADAYPRVDFSKASTVASAASTASAAPKKEAYVPPALRNRPGASGSPGLKPSSPAAAASKPQVAIQVATISSGLTNREKNIRKLQKKLDQIRELKAKLNDGVALELNQLDKIRTEAEVAKELEAVMAQPDV